MCCEKHKLFLKKWKTFPHLHDNIPLFDLIISNKKVFDFSDVYVSSYLLVCTFDFVTNQSIGFDMSNLMRYVVQCLGHAESDLRVPTTFCTPILL